MPWYLIVILVLLVPIGLIMGAGVISLIGMSSIRIEPIEPQHADAITSVHANEAAWAEENGFEWLGCFSIEAPMNPAGLAEVWRLPDVPTYFCLYLIAGKTFTDRVTLLENDGGVTTGSTASAMFMPAKPGSFMQAFTKRSLDDLWAYHLDAEEFVLERLGLLPGGIDRPVNELMTEACIEQVRYFRSKPLWPLRIPVRFLFQSRFANLPIAQRYAHLANRPAGV